MAEQLIAITLVSTAVKCVLIVHHKEFAVTVSFSEAHFKSLKALFIPVNLFVS